MQGTFTPLFQQDKRLITEDLSTKEHSKA